VITKNSGNATNGDRLAFIWKEVHVLADGAPTILTWRDTLIQLARNRNHMHWKEEDEMVGAAVAA